MPDPTPLAGDLEGDLRSYFAVTTSTELPRRVRAMSARTLRSRRNPAPAVMAGAIGVLATAALVFVVATHAGSHDVYSALSAGTGTAPKAAARPAFTGPQPATITYPGVDTGELAGSGVRLLPPAGHGSAVLTPAQAQAAAAASLGAEAGTPGPAILSFAELLDRPQALSCLCWAVDVPVRGGVTQSPGEPSLRTELVLVDAVDGRAVAALSANGIP